MRTVTTVLFVLFMLVGQVVYAGESFPNELQNNGTVVGYGECYYANSPAYCFFVEYDGKKYVVIGKDMGDEIYIEYVVDEALGIIWSRNGTI